MKKLILIRHAKSDWDFKTSDFNRSITEKGSKDAISVAKKVIKLLPQDYQVWSSAANRATQTALLFTKEFNYPKSAIEFRDSLYTFDCFKLEEEIKNCTNSISNLIVFAHNEAITDFVNKYGSVYIDNVPTAGFVFIEFNTQFWNSITKGETKHFIKPKELR
jgi:phosphohistidine phosphatase